MLFKPEVGTGWSTVGIKLFMYITSSLVQTIHSLVFSSPLNTFEQRSEIIFLIFFSSSSCFVLHS